MHCKNQKGFTLVEVITVIFILIILMSIGSYGLGRARMKSRDMKRITDLNNISIALEFYRNANGTYPKTSDVEQDRYWYDNSNEDDFLEILVPDYMSEVPIDPQNTGGGSGAWESDYRGYMYGATEDGKSFMLLTRLETDDHPDSTKYKCGKWTGGWTGYDTWDYDCQTVSYAVANEACKYGYMAYRNCCDPFDPTVCTDHEYMADTYIINGPIIP